MPSRLRAALVIVLTVGLLAYFLRGVDARRRVGRNPARRRPAARARACRHAGDLRACGPLRWQYLLAPIGPTRFSTAFRTTVIGFAASFLLPARAGRGAAAVSAGAAGAVAADRGVCDHHSRAAAGPGYRPAAVRRLRRARRSGVAVGRSRAVRAGQGRRPAGARPRRWRGSAVFFVLAGHPGAARAPRAAGSSGCCRRSSRGPSPGSSKPSRRGWRSCGSRAACWFRCCCRFRSGCRSRRGSG